MILCHLQDMGEPLGGGVVGTGEIVAAMQFLMYLLLGMSQGDAGRATL